METSLNLPLSGTEVRKAVVAWFTEELDYLLTRDDRLADHNAFRGFSAKISLDLSLPGAVYDTINRELATTVGELGCDPQIVKVAAEMPEMPVDQVRVETGQEVTVQSTAPDGRSVERKVRYSKPKRGRAKTAESATSKA